MEHYSSAHAGPGAAIMDEPFLDPEGFDEEDDEETGGYVGSRDVGGDL